MPYSAEINRNNPACFFFLVDLSSSMLEPFGAQPEKSKAEGVADAINRLLSNLVIKCTKSEGVRDYFTVGVISYGGKVLPALGGALDGLFLVPVSKIAEHPLRLEKRTRRIPDGAGGFLETAIKFPVWFDPKAAGRTPMCGAFTTAQTVLKKFIEQYPKAFPPLVVNITDGMPTDGDPIPHAQALQALKTQDGNVLVFNAHVSEKDVKPVEFPASEAGLPDDFARMLFRMSSSLPPQMLEAAKAEGFPVQPNSRGFVFNADLISVIRFLDIGTRVAQPPAAGGK